MRALKREIDSLERALEQAQYDGDRDEQQEIERELRDIEREEDARQRWEEEGDERGWR